MCKAVDAAIFLINRIVEHRTDELNKGIDSKYNVDFDSVHKLLYYAQGIMLENSDKSLFVEDIYADISGPCVEGLNYLFDLIGSEPVTEKLEEKRTLTPDRREVLTYVAENFGEIPIDELIFDSKKHSVYKDVFQENKRVIMSKERIKEFFSLRMPRGPRFTIEWNVSGDADEMFKEYFESLENL